MTEGAGRQRSEPQPTEVAGLRKAPLCFLRPYVSCALGTKAADAAFTILNGETPKSDLPVRIFPQPVQYTKDNVDT